MHNRWLCSAVTLPLGMLAAAAGLAQPPAPPTPLRTPPPISGTRLYDPAQLPSFNGKVQQFTLSPRGEIDGLILTDGTEVITPPQLSTAIAYAIKPGDAITIHGLRAAAIPLLQATTIWDHTTNRTVIDQGPAIGPDGPPSVQDPTTMTEVQGAVRMSLHGAQGEVNGVLLADGTVLRLPPGAANNATEFLQPGKTLVAQGYELTSPIGKVLEVRSLGTSRTNITPIDEAPPPDPRGPARPPLPGPGTPTPPPPPPGR